MEELGPTCSKHSRLRRSECEVSMQGGELVATTVSPTLMMSALVGEGISISCSEFRVLV